MRDLFGQIPVLVSEVSAWITLIPRLPHNHRFQRGHYAKHWNVVEKIQQAKLSGSFPEIMGGTDCPHCGAELLPESKPPPASPQDELQALQRRIAVLEMVISAQAAASRLQGLPDGLARRVTRK